MQGLSAVNQLIGWADYLAIDVRLEDVEQLSGTLGLDSRLPRALTAEALVLAPMPCGGMAKCGVCTVSTNSKDVLLCEEGPVVSIDRLIN